MIRFCVALAILLMGPMALAESYYDILKDEFRSARGGIQYTDFDKAGHPNSKSCVEVYPDQPNEEHLIQLNRFTKHKQGQGPLLPGKSITKVIFRNYSASPFRGNEFATVKSEVTSREVRSELVRGENTVWEIRVRKTAEVLVFRRDLTQGEDTVRYYGYCYSKGAPEIERPASSEDET